MKNKKQRLMNWKIILTMSTKKNKHYNNNIKCHMTRHVNNIRIILMICRNITKVLFYLIRNSHKRILKNKNKC